MFWKTDPLEASKSLKIEMSDLDFNQHYKFKNIYQRWVFS